MNNMNVLFLFSDEHRKDASGCYGHNLVQTPNLDKLASTGTRFTNAYTSSPICVPARASLATGQYVHKTRCWSNAEAYQGDPVSWGHHLQNQGHRVDSIGKLHYRGKEFDNGFENEIMPLYIKNGKGWIKGLLRNHEGVLDCSSYAREIGPGGDSYTDYDLGVTREACSWLKNSENNSLEKPWTLFVSWLRPHYPLTCPQEFYDLYPLDKMDQARFLDDDQLPAHPVLRTIRQNFDYDKHFDDQTRQIARASYYGLCSFLDYQIGKVLNALKQSGQADNTLIIYTSDHGDHNGDRRMWTKMSLYDESSGIPMIIKGPGIPEDKVVNTLSSLVDIYPTILEAVGAQSDNIDRPGIALQSLANMPDFDRPVISEYHDGGSPTGLFMLRNARWKYNYYPGHEPELFDMQSDSDERIDLGTDPEYADIRALCYQQMLELVDPEKENANAFSDQAEMIEKLGGAQAIIDSEEFDFTPIGS
jgi:choline-sulfatase